MIKKQKRSAYDKINSIIKYWFIVMILWMCIIRPFLMWEGRDFPKESELLYTEGMMLAGTALSGSRSGTRVGAIQICETAKKCHSYYCGYSAYHISEFSSCFDNYQNLKPHHRKQAKVGYYYQKDFLWFHNPNRQMVSLEVDGEMIKTYYGTQKYLKRSHKFKIILSFLIFLFSATIFYYTFIFEFKVKSHSASNKD